MDMNEILSIVLKGLGSGLATIAITYASILFAKLKNKIKDGKVIQYIKEVVKAAEQLFPNEGKKMGAEKYEYVVNQVLAKFPSLTNNEYLKSLIEGAVYSLSQQTKQITQEVANTVETIEEIKEVNNVETVNAINNIVSN